jgi:protein tyrosine phosphatase (PTP) superfamily phosphohydrolase (DUF442 family)
MDAPNVHQVFDWLWSSGQPSRNDILELPELGVEVVVNLAPPTASNALPGEAELVTGLGMDYVQIPVDWARPEAEQYRRFVRVLQAYSGCRIWLHCAKNMRVSAFVYLYRKLVRGETEQDASFPMRAVWQPDVVWRSFIADVLASPPFLDRDLRR